ncbi:saccharopine dehydrogenase NADP-binding domain-containing protein [Eionea flava]
MTQRVLIIGGYGNFGRFIAKELAKEHNIQLIIAGRSLYKATSMAEEIEAHYSIEAVDLDITQNLPASLASINPHVVIHTSGPFQDQGYDVAKACIDQSAHYIDLADGREFVAGITTLNNRAKAKGVLLISGASSVPCLTSALVDDYEREFTLLESLDYGITTAQKTTRGLATTAAILGYTGKAFTTLLEGKVSNIFGWQGLRARKYQHLGWRLLSYCDVPDLVLFSKRYTSVKTIRFYAGLEIPFIHIVLWLLSWAVRLGVIRNLQSIAPTLLKLSFMFDWLGTDNSGFHMELKGKGSDGKEKIMVFELIARSGDGPYIPCMPAILMTKKIINNVVTERGAYPCMGFISKDEYLHALKDLDISWLEL